MDRRRSTGVGAGRPRGRRADAERRRHDSTILLTISETRQHYAEAEVADAVVTRMSHVAGHWMLLVVAEDWCGDSSNTVPYVAKLVDVASNLAMRIIDSRAGRALMNAHRTPDGRAATPTVVLLNTEFVAMGCWVERPSTLQQWFLDNEERLDEEELFRQKYDWFAEDAGGATLDEIVAMIEAADAGEPNCQD